MNTLRDAFLERRLKLGLTQEQTAAGAGLTRKTVSDFENGKSSMTVANLGRLLRVVGLELTTREAAPRPTLDELAGRYADDEPVPIPRRRVRRARP